MTYCRQATLQDVEYLSTRLREADKREMMASHGYEPLHGLMESFSESDICRVFCTAEDEPLCIHGTAPGQLPNAASAWLLGTDRLRDFRKDFLKHTRMECQHFHQKHRVLYNFVDERNTVSITWLKWIGCEFIQRLPEHGVAKIPFLFFIHRDNQCVW